MSEVTIPAGMKPWAGKHYRAPDDWDRGPVLFRSGGVMRCPPGVVWKLGWDHSYGDGDVLAYTPKPDPIAASVQAALDSDGVDDAGVVEAMRKAFLADLECDGFMSVPDEGRYPVLNGCWDLDAAMTKALVAYRNYQEMV